MKILLDSWAWLEILRAGPKAEEVKKEISKASEIYTTVLNIYEVCKKTRRAEGDEAYKESLHFMLSKAEVIGITLPDSIDAVLFGDYKKLHAADAFIFSLAVKNDCRLLTGDPHFRGKKGVIYLGP